MKTKKQTKANANCYEKTVKSRKCPPACEATIENLCKRHNALARYVGVPCTVKPDRITPYPATLGEHGVPFKGFCGYRISLFPFKGNFDRISFRGIGNGKSVVSGYIIDENGYIESYALQPDNRKGWATLPLTAKSHALYASVPLKNNKPLWDDLSAELSSNGLREEIKRAILMFGDRISNLENTVFATLQNNN